TGHSDVRLIGRSLLEDLLVGRYDMSVSSKCQGNPAIEVAPQQLLVTRGFGMDVDDDDSGRVADPLEDAIGRVKRAVNGSHVGAAEHGEDCRERTVACLDERQLWARRLDGKIGRPQDTIGPLEDLEDLVLPVDMVAHRHDVDPGLEELLVAAKREAG